MLARLLLGCGVLLLAGCGSAPKAAVTAPALSPVKLAMAEGATPAARLASLEEIVEGLKGSPDEKDQDTVAEARIHAGFVHAGEGDFESARAVFEEASAEYRGTGAMDPGFGRLDDQAAYQAVVCLVADGKGAKAKEAFVAYLEERPLSPLVHAVHRRLLKMLGEGESRETYDRMLQDAVSAQEEWSRKELANCGPRVIEHYAAEHLGRKVDLEEVRKVCKTDEDGTALAGMVAGFETLGVRAVGMEANLADLRALKLPAVLLHDSHYVLLLEVTRDSLVFYDPMFKSRQTAPLPKENKDAFLATVLALTPLQTKKS